MRVWECEGVGCGGEYGGYATDFLVVCKLHKACF